MASEERLRELEEKYEGYTVYDNQGSKIGKVDDLFVDETDNEEYIGVKMGFLGRKSTLIPTEVVRINEGEKSIEVSESKDHVKDAPSFDDDEDITAEYEERIRRHFGLESLEGESGRGSYASSAGAAGYTSSDDDSEEDHDRETGSSGYAPEGSDRESSTGARSDEYEASSETEHGETRESGAGGQGVVGSSEDGEDRESTGGSETSEDRTEYQETGSSAEAGASSESPSGSSQPTTSRQTEETETFQEGGRTKVRRRVIREEVVDADDQNTSS